jgi:hypothetical protein
MLVVFLEGYLQPPAPDQHESMPVWVLKFKQPAGDYALFRRRLEANKISLENVLLKSGLRHQLVWRMTGTIKVCIKIKTINIPFVYGELIEL